MKMTRMLKKHLSWLPIGWERAARRLFQWIKEPSERDKVMRRFGITVGTPVIFIILTVEHPAVSVLGSFLILVGVGAWYGHIEEREMTIQEVEYQAPYEVNGEVMTGGEVLRTLVAAHPGEGLEYLADRLSRHAGGSGVTAEALARDMDAWGVPIPRRKNPSPIEDLPPSGADESAGQDLVDRVPQEGTMFAEPCSANQEVVPSDHDEDNQDPVEGGPGTTGGDRVPDEQLGGNHGAGYSGDVRDEAPGEDVRGDRGEDQASSGVPGAEARRFPPRPEAMAPGSSVL